MTSETMDGAGPDAAEIIDRTLAALRALSETWRSSPAAGATAVADAALAAAHGDLGGEGLAWAMRVGLAHAVPAAAAQGCEPITQSCGSDGLSPSKAGGSPIKPHPALLVAPAPPCGHGVFATRQIPKGTVLGEYVGEVRSYDVWCAEITSRKVKLRGSDLAVPFIPHELYATWTGNGPRGAGVVVDAFSAGNAMRFVNCSCCPNASFQDFGEGFQKHSRVKVLAKRDIRPGEQVSVNYGWYYDDATLEDVRAEAVRAFNADAPVFTALASRLSRLAPRELGEALADADACAELAAGAGVDGHLSEAACVVLCAAGYAVGGDASCTASCAIRAPLGHADASFLRRFVDPASALSFLRSLATEGSEARLAVGIDAVPSAVWHVYEVVGATVVGIPCRCGLDPSLNQGGQCSGIIGRPLQAVCDGRGDEVARSSPWNVL